MYPTNLERTILFILNRQPFNQLAAIKELAQLAQQYSQDELDFYKQKVEKLRVILEDMEKRFEEHRISFTTPTIDE